MSIEKSVKEFAKSRELFSTKPLKKFDLLKETLDLIRRSHIKKEHPLEIKKIVFGKERKRVTIVFENFVSRATCQGDDEYDELFGFLIAYFKGVKTAQHWTDGKIHRYLNTIVFPMAVEEQKAFLKAVFVENADMSFNSAVKMFDGVWDYWFKQEKLAI